MRNPAIVAVFLLLAGASSAQQFDRGQEPTPLPPAESAREFTVPDDLEIELVLAEPLISQPLHLTFDERGRLWVVEYRQYPEPAGLKQVSHDKFWRSVYDQVPPPPPNHFPGKDRVSIHEDTDGDGRFDAHKVFVDGLNIATSVALGRGGVWVLNPPYLLFYPDRNRDDVPDGDPEVHLSGFGLEDTHSVANSLRWGPDGWLYACQGSTVSGHVKIEPLPNNRAPVSTKVIHTLGQNIWRYHPEMRRYEVFSEGGGNAFGIEVDARGRMFSGHNGGDTRGFHYVQGAYLQKGFQKHGELSNPYAFGYFPQMANNRVERFTHTFLIYEADALPERYRGKLFGIEPLQGRVVLSEITPAASSFATRDLEHVVTTTDRWFRPVDLKLGPDGAIYIADWHDFSINHWKNYNGNMDAVSGRVWRLKAKGAKPMERFDLTQQPDAQLLATLGHPNRWWREAAGRVLAERTNMETRSTLAKEIETTTGVSALNALWTWHAIGARTASSARNAEENRADGTPARFLKHPEPQVRLWAVRFIGDPSPGALDTGGTPISRWAGTDVGSRARSDATHLTGLAATESNLEVRIQLAATAKRLPASDALPIIKALALRDEDAADPRQPLMIWWALEAKAGTDREAVGRLLTDATLWDRPLVMQHLLERLMRRYAQAGSGEDLVTCAMLFELSPSAAHSEILYAGFEKAFEGRSVAGLPEQLLTAMARHGVGSLAIGIRRGAPGAIDEAVRILANPEAPVRQRRQLIEVLGELGPAAALQPLLGLLSATRDEALLRATLAALQRYDQPSVPAAVLGNWEKLPASVQPTAATLLGTRREWSSELVRAVADQRVAADAVPLEVVRQMKKSADPKLTADIDRLWPKAGRPSSDQMEQQIAQARRSLGDGHGDPYNGKRLFTQACASCHRLFNQGSDMGPDLTSHNRGDAGALLLAIVNPSAEIREGYENFSVETGDGRTLGGFIVEQNAERVILRGLDGQSVVVGREEIKDLKAAGLSLMPEGLLDGLAEQQVRDLFAYLRSSQPLNE